MITVYKLDDAGREVWQYPARVLERDAHGVRLEAFFNRDDMELGYATFKRGDRFVEYFYTDRWYNLFAVYDRDDGALKGWYANICRPAEIGEATVRGDDLALDLWITPEGQVTVLDEEEYVALPLSSEERQQADAAVSDLHLMAQQGTLPY
ncbi:DUF402 domain-containing protein [Promineifilum sp.]|uniref:DUF402 domain-containing protein n=1 Tax=Promineifilum sp. TaxID=2664178 RepID=UPI0035B3F413